MSEGKEPARGAQKEPELLALQPGRHRPEGEEPLRVGPREPEPVARPSDRVMAEGKEPLRGGQKERELLGLRSDQSSDRDREGSGGKEPPRGGQMERELLGLRSDQSSDRDRDREGSGGKEPLRGGQMERELLGLRSDQSSDRDRDRDGSGGKEPPRGGQMERELLGLRSDQSSDRDRDGSGGKEPPRGGQKEPEARSSGLGGSEGTEPPRRGPREPELRLLPSAGDRSERRELPRIGPKALELLVPAACLARVLKQVAEEDVPLKGFPGLPSFSSGSGLLTLEEALNLGDADLAHLLGLADDEDKCRQIRKQYRQLIQNVQQNREDIVNASSDSLTEALEEANALFDTVSRTREAALDAQFLVLASDLGKEKAKQLTSDMSFFNQVAFCDFLLLFVGLNLLEADREDALSDCDETMAHTFWETVHKEATSWILRADTFHFMFGSFKTDAAVPKRRVEHKRKAPKAEESGDMPTKLRCMDLSCNQEATEKEVERILGLLQTYFRKYPDTPVSYFEFVIDPTSFSRTVENIFYVSFIIRDGFARISLDQDRLPILEPIDIDQMGEGSDFSFHSRKQGIISLSLQDWKNIVATFEISEAMIKKSY